MNRAERRQQKKEKAGPAPWNDKGSKAKPLQGQARAHTERGLVRHVSQQKGRRS